MASFVANNAQEPLDPQHFIKNLDTGEAVHVSEAEALASYLQGLTTWANTGAGQEVTVACVDAELRADGGFSGRSNASRMYTRYEIEVRLRRGYVGETAIMSNWTIYRRYNDFVVLHAAMMGKYAQLKSLTLPPKRWFASRFSKEVVERRRTALTAYLNACASVIDPRACPLLAPFLRVARRNRELPRRGGGIPSQ